MKCKIIKANRSGYIECPFCKETMPCTPFSSDSCDHLAYKCSDGTAMFKKTDMEKSEK